MTELIHARDYLALRLKSSRIQLTQMQRDEVRAWLVRALPAQVLSPFARIQGRQTQIREAISQCIAAGVLTKGAEAGSRHAFSTPTDELIEATMAQTTGLDALESLLGDPDVTSITVISESNILYEKGGKTHQSPFGFESRERMIEVIKNLAIRGGQQLTPAKPTADLAFPPPQVVRVHLTIDPVTTRYGAFCALRRGRDQAWTLDTLVGKGMMDNAIADFLRSLLIIPASLIVGGEPSSGKTALLEVLISLIDHQHVALLEQAAELNPQNRLVSFFEVPPGSETVSLATLTIDSLRKNVQVVVIGETRGSEAGWLLFIAGAMKGILTTLHGRSSRQVVERMATNAQIHGDPPTSPFVGNKELAREAVASAFDFVIHCTQLPNGQRIISSIEHISGVDPSGDIQLTSVVTAQIRVSDGANGRKQLTVTWEFNPAWVWPKDLAFAAEMAKVRSEVGQTQPGALDARLHRQYQQACLAADQGGYATAIRFFSEILRAAPSGYLDAEMRLRQALQAHGGWAELQQWAIGYLAGLDDLIRDREWQRLDQALKALDEKVELRVAVASIRDLKSYRERVIAGLDLTDRWAEARRRVQVWSSQGNPDQAARALRQVTVSGLNDELHDEVRRLRLDVLERWAEMEGVTPEQTLRIYHEMFALVDEETQPARMAEIVNGIRTLEKQVGNITFDMERLNTAAHRRTGQTGILTTPQTVASQTAAAQPAVIQGAETLEHHRIYLQGVTAMNEGRWTAAWACFEQVPGYRRADTFLQSLDGLKARETKGKFHGRHT